MPSGVFKPYAGVSTAILIFTKNGNTDKIWFYEMESDGFTLDDRRSELGNGIGDIEDIIENWEKCQVNKEISPNNNDKWFWVSKDEIIKNDYNFNVSNFKETNYTEMVYDDPKDILEKILDLENEVIKDMLEIKDLMEL
jgi:type I restriction enzyme M protein